MRFVKLGIFIVLILLSNLMIKQTELNAQNQNQVTIDGEINDGEYDFELIIEDGSFNLYWLLDTDQIYFGIKAITSGYVALNIDPGRILKDADLYYGWVTNGTAEMVDTFSTQQFGPPRLDTEDGGSDDILDFAGREDATHTIFEFTRLYFTGDSHDNDLYVNGTLVSWVIGPSDNFGDERQSSGRIYINFVSGFNEEVTDYTIYYYIGGGIVIIIVIIVITIYLLRKRKTSVKEAVV